MDDTRQVNGEQRTDPGANRDWLRHRRRREEQGGTCEFPPGDWRRPDSGWGLEEWQRVGKPSHVQPSADRLRRMTDSKGDVVNKIGDVFLERGPKEEPGTVSQHLSIGMSGEGAQMEGSG